MSYKKLLTIIVTVYNAEKYLDNTLRGITKLNMKDFECVIVDDGSTDNSLEICSRYYKIDNRFVVYSTENNGVSHARNIGISKSSGKYITFIDADDIVTSDIYDFLSNESKRDIYCVNMSILDKGKQKRIAFQDKGIVYNLSHYSKYMHSVCNKLFKREIIIKNNIKFDEAKVVCEDLEFVLKYYVANNSIEYIDGGDYVYRMHNESVTHKETTLKMAENTFNVYEKINEICVKSNQTEKFSDLLSYLKLYGSMLYITRKATLNCGKFRENVGSFRVWNYSIRPDFWCLSLAASMHMDLIPKIFVNIKAVIKNNG